MTVSEVSNRPSPGGKRQKARILVAEDEGIIAEDIQMSLEELGYEVVGVVATARGAIETAEETHPDLVLMDVELRDKPDGIDAAAHIRSRLDIPIIYLTAHADDRTLERAKITEPFGYMIKPFRERELHSNIEMALFKHELERRLKESEEWLMVTLSSIGEAVISADARGRVTFMNPEAESLTGWKAKQALAKDLKKVFKGINEVTGKSAGDLVKKLMSGTDPVEIAETCNVLESKRGKRVPIEMSIAPITDGGKSLGAVLVFRDITERKRAVERLRLLSAAVEQSSEGVVLTDMDGQILFVNNAFAQMHKHGPEKLIGKNHSVLHTKEQMPSVKKALKEVKDKGVFSGELWQKRRDGGLFPALLHSSLLRDDDGDAVGIIGAIRDITEIKESQQALEESRRKLEAYSVSLEIKVKDRTQDLEESRKELKRYSESLEKTNDALKIIIQGIEEQKKEVEKKIAHNLNLTVKPIIDQLKSQELPDTAGFLLKSLEYNLGNMFASFGFNLIKDGHLLTPKEIRICEMIRSGLSSKQMAKVMGISPQTILVHRKNIRKKLGLAKTKQNLSSFLKTNLE